MIDVLSRRTDRISRARVQLEFRRARGPLVIVLAGALLFVALIAFTLSRVSPTLLADAYNVRFAVDDVTAVKGQGLNEVRLNGVPVGEIKKVTNEGDQPVLVAEIKTEFGRLYRDARAELRPNTALQDMYLDIVDRGTPATGRLNENDTLPSSRTALPVNVSDVLNMFGPSQRVRLQTLVDELGNGLDDRGRSLRALFVTLAPFIADLGEISQELGAREPQVRRLVHNVGILTDELGSRQRALRQLVEEGAGTLGALGDSALDLDATLRGLPPTLSAVTSSFAATRRVLGDVDGALTALTPVARQLPGSLSDLRKLSASLRPAVRALRRPVGDLVPLAQALRPVADDLDTAVGLLRPQIDTVNKVTRDLAGCKSGVQGFFQWNASMSKFGDSRGPVPRGNVVVGAQSSGVLADPGEYAPPACTPGQPIGGRVPTEKDKR